MYKIKYSALLIGIGYFMCFSSATYAKEFKCLVEDNTGGHHIVLVDTVDIEDAGRTSQGTKLKNRFGRASPVIKIIECQLETESFTTSSGKKLDKETPR